MSSITPSDLLSVQLLINGNVCNAAIIRIEVVKSINKIAEASIVLQDGSKVKEDFQLSDSSDFVPGNKIEIKAGYHSKEQTVFKGVIISQAISIDADVGPSLRIECVNEAFAITRGNKNNYFTNSTDSEIINKILGDYNVSKSVENTKLKYEEVIQYGATDWDFILSRAKVNGLVIVVDDDKMRIEKPNLSSKAVLNLTYGDDIIEMDIKISGEEQFMSVDATSWNPSSQKIVEGESLEPNTNNQGNISGADLAKVLNVNSQLQTTVTLEKEALDSWANVQLLKSRLSRFQGTVLCEGNANIKPNTLVEIKGVGEKINGNAYISSVSHELYEGSWLTKITVGFPLTESINVLSASGRIPAISGLQIGLVKQIHDDPAGEFRVLVTLPLIKNSNDGIWARLSSFHASNGFGNFFYPEVGDEVILGFLDDNPSAPIILGSVYSKKNTPSKIPDEKNTHKSITTRTLMTVDFDEENKAITIKTPGNNTIRLSDKDKEITLMDQNNNMVQLNDSGITIDSKKDIVISAANNVSISATNIDVKASSNLDLLANNITEKAQLSYSAQAGVSAELKASGNTTVKGAMVAIN